MGALTLLGAHQKRQKRPAQEWILNVESFAGRFSDGGCEIFQLASSLNTVCAPTVENSNFHTTEVQTFNPYKHAHTDDTTTTINISRFSSCCCSKFTVLRFVLVWCGQFSIHFHFWKFVLIFDNTGMHAYHPLRVSNFRSQVLCPQKNIFKTDHSTVLQLK